MSRPVGFSVAVSSLQGWSTLFAREPEPDLDIDDGPSEADRTDTAGSSKDPQKSPGRRPLLLVIVLVVAAAGVYLAMDPGMVMDLLGLGAESTPPIPTVPTSPAKNTSPVQAAKEPAPPAQPALSAAPSAAGNQAPASGPGLAPTAIPRQDIKPAGASPAAPIPRFSEGQRVVAVPDPTKQAAPVSLSSDSAGTRQGPMISPGSALTIVDGELRNDAWVYAVRSQQGATGWIPENRLQAAKP
jgi:hypothetical protein